MGVTTARAGAGKDLPDATKGVSHIDFSAKVDARRGLLPLMESCCAGETSSRWPLERRIRMRMPPLWVTAVTGTASCRLREKWRKYIGTNFPCPAIATSHFLSQVAGRSEIPGLPP